ncbi:Hpt domain protein [Rickettsiella grylli]|uniref:Hpt domain protein n=1 Tax=Rickettsiella grylli TaxID=59196 RepID=A8PNM4_9COXI|nr:Hpt domain protein [Rickettsiella grylli]
MDVKKKLSDLPIIDNRLNQLFTKDSHKIIKELLHLFLKETPQLRAEINLAFQNKQQKKLESALHKLLGSCAYCGLIRLKYSLLVLEKAIKKGDYSNVLLEQFNRELQETLDKADEVVHSK